MLERLGIFDLFSYTLPGGIYLFMLILALQIWSIFPVDLNLELDATGLVILVALSYLIGLLVSPIKWTPWDRFLPCQRAENILEKLQQNYPNITLHMYPNQWPVLQASTGLANHEYSLAMDKLRATHIMLRSVSLAFFVCSFLSVAYVIRNPGLLVGWLGFLISLGASFLAAKGSRTFKSWTYHYTFELMIARVVRPEDFVTRKS